METRLAQRVKLSLEAVLKIAEEPKQKFALSQGNCFVVNILDISKMGIGLLSKYFMPKGLIVELQLNGDPFGLKETVKVDAEIRWCNYIKPSEYRCGVKFLNILAKYENAIAQFVSANERRKEPRLKLSE